jgi:hypothetical protein
MSPRELLDAARELVDRATPSLAGLWPRAAALLARQALESALDALWVARAPGIEAASARAQLSCLPDYLPDRALAAEVAYTWVVLSAACHHHAYELGPTEAELQSRFAVLCKLLEQLPSGND